MFSQSYLELQIDRSSGRRISFTRGVDWRGGQVLEHSDVKSADILSNSRWVQNVGAIVASDALCFEYENCSKIVDVGECRTGDNAIM
jgi:hypothetical protein